MSTLANISLPRRASARTAAGTASVALGWRDTTGVALLAVVAFGALPQASVPALPRAALTATICLIAAVHLWFSRHERLVVPTARGVTWALAGLLALGFAQLLPIEAPSWFGGEHANVVRDAMRQATGSELGSLSLVPAQTATRARELCGMLVVFCAAATLLRGRLALARTVVWTLVALASLLSAYGIAVRAGVAPPIVADLQREVVSATFFNRNHFAALLELAILSGIGLWAHQRQAVRIALAFALGLCTIGLFATESRGGCAALVVGIVGWLGFTRMRRGQKVWPIGLALTPLLVLGAYLVAPASLHARFSTVGAELAGAGTRPDIWLGGLRLWLAFPWTGIGFGCYRDASPLTQPLAIGGRVEHAHSDPLQMLVEGGLLGLALALLCCVSFVRFVRPRMISTQDARAASLAMGCTAALIAIGVHSLVEFNWQIPALGWWTATLAGLVVAVSSPLRKQRTSKPMALSTPPRTWYRRIVPTPRAALAGALLSVATVSGSEALHHHLVADAGSHGANSAAFRLGRLDLAAAWHAGHGEADLAAGMALLPSAPDRALAAADRALARNPFAPAAHRLRGRAALALGQIDAAEAALTCAIALSNPFDRPSQRRVAAQVLFEAGALDRGLAWTRELLEERPESALEVLRELFAQLPAYELIAPAVPEHEAARLAFIAVLGERGEFVGRELELAALAGRDVIPGRTTIDADAWIARCHVGEELDLSTSERHVRIELDLRVDSQDATPKTPLVFRCEGPGAAVYRSFPVTPGTQTHTFGVDPTFPAGRYECTLEIAPRIARLPLHRFVVDAPAPLPLAWDSSIPIADNFMWSCQMPGRRERPRDGGLPLRTGDLLQRKITLPADRTQRALLTITCDRAASLAVRYAGSALQDASVAASNNRSFVIPFDAPQHGLLELALTADSAASDRAVTLERLFLEPSTY